MQTPGQKSAIISSTAMDLPEHRKQVLEACLAVEIFPRVMESLPARDADAIRVSLEMVNAADIYIGIFAWRYGHIPEGHAISITEMEFNRAVERQIPVLIFLSDEEHPITFEMVEVGDEAQMKLAALKDRASKGRGRRKFKSPAELRAHVIQALADLKNRELQAASPTDAIRAEQQRLEELDPRFTVDITATARSMSIGLRPVQPTPYFPKLKFLGEDRTTELKEFLELGQPFQIKAANVEVAGSPIHNDVLRQLGDAEITFTGVTFKGCLQFHFGSQADPLCIQIDGEWVLAPKRVSFKGRLGESPLTVVCIRERGDDGAWKQCEMVFRLNWGAWEGQALLALAYSVELDAFLRQDKFLLRFYIRGYREWPDEHVSVNDPNRGHAIEALDWLQKCKRVAKLIGANPPFPAANAISQIESGEVRLLVKLIESGVHEQGNAGEEVGMSGEIEPGESKLPVGSRELTASRTEDFREINFFGIKIPFGPLIHTWTDLELIAARPVNDVRTEMTFRGGANSVWRIEYQRPGATQSAPTSSC